MQNRLALLAVTVAAATLHCQNRGGVESRSEPAPGAREVEILAAAPSPCPRRGDVLLCDGFDQENAGRPTLMYDGFEQWEVVDGTVDVIGRGSEWDFLPGNGLYVDLDGDRPDGYTFDAGRLVSRDELLLRPGSYELSFRLAGSQRGDANTTIVRLGDAYAHRVTLRSSAPFRRYVVQIAVRRMQPARLSFENEGADGYGLLLDDVLLRRL